MRAGKPVVLCFSGLDPSGGAGLQADAETLLSLGCHCAPIAAALTVQDTVNASRMVPVAADLMAEQARCVLADMSVRCFKLGLLGSAAAVKTVCGILREHADIPVVMDPVGAAGGGYAFAGSETLAAMRELLLPLATIVTPNSVELTQLAPEADTPDAAAGEVLRRGCRNVLLTGGHESGKHVVNRWFRAIHETTREATREDTCLTSEFRWPRLNHEFHGSGCTLASAVAGNLALGRGDMENALREAQQYTWESLRRAWRAGAGQHLPERGFRREP